MVKCQQVMEIMERIAPKGLAEEWDNPGLLAGSPQQDIERIYLCLDVSDEAVERAVETGANMIISHHPLIFRPLKKIRTDLPLGKRLQKLLKHDIAVFSAHTNLDIAEGGVNDVLAERIGLQDIEPLGSGEKGTLGRIGYLARPLSLEAFAELVREKLFASHVRIVSAGSQFVRKVALCSGSGADLIGKAAFYRADVYVTSDIKYHDAQHAAEQGLHLVDAGHFSTEFPIVTALRMRLEKEFAERKLAVEILEDTYSKDLFQVI